MYPHTRDARLANYRLGRLIGTGGMGSVYLARDLTLQRDVAIKFIAPELAGDESARRRLLREARAAAALDHPNICGVHEVIVTDDGRACIVMQYVEGETLADVLRRGPVEPRQALSVAAQLAGALASAHQHGVVHRDIKPQNIVITPGGQAKLLDFGIARIVEPPTANDATTTSLTDPGVIAGTPAYMSPEQVRQQPVDARSDLFSLGAVLYEMLTGRRAFTGATVGEIYSQILETHPSAPSTVRPGLSTQHDELCRRLLAKHPEDRFASAAEVAGALRVLLPDTARNTVPPQPSPVPRPRTSLLVAAAAIVIFAAVGVWKWTGGSPLPVPPQEARSRFERGVQKIRDGAYYGGVLALTNAIKEFGEYPMAYARLAEAYIELDDGRRAQEAMLRVQDLVPNRARLSPDDRLRLDAIRSFVLREAVAAVTAYQQLVQRNTNDSGAWVDLGRAQEAAGDFESARASYERAIAADKLNAAAHLRRALILKELGRHDDAMSEFAEAERLYAADSNVEGQAETLLRRGAYLTAIGSLPAARKDFEASKQLAASINSLSHEVRVDLGLAAVAASEGHFSEALQASTAAIDRAQDAGLDIIAAEGLVDLANVLMLARQFDDADKVLLRASAIADNMHAERTELRVALNRASIRQIQREAPGETLKDVERVRQFAAGRYRRFELAALLLASRLHEDLGDWDEVRSQAEAALALAENINDGAQAAEALLSLATHARETGALPEALRTLERAEAIYEEQGNTASIAYTLTNRAELLAHMGRHEDAEVLLREVDAKAAAGSEVFLRRQRRAHAIRALNAVSRQDWSRASAHARAAMAGDLRDSTFDLASAVLRYASAKTTRLKDPAPAWTAREPQYWALLAELEVGQPRDVYDAVKQKLDAGVAGSSYEAEWRFAAIGAIAAGRAGDVEARRHMAERSAAALERLISAWGNAADRYFARADIGELRKAVHTGQIRGGAS